jgi:hypothetical protein
LLARFARRAIGQDYEADHFPSPASLREAVLSRFAGEVSSAALRAKVFLGTAVGEMRCDLTLFYISGFMEIWKQKSP